MSQDIILKRSGIAEAQPTAEQLQYGELALNYTDGKLHYKQNPSDNIVAFLDEPGVRELQAPGRTIFVSKNGNDSNSGNTWASAVATIEKAIELAWVYDVDDMEELQDPKAQWQQEVVLIEIGPGLYEVEGHLDMPDNCTIRSVYRTVSIRPKEGTTTEDSGVHEGEEVYFKNRNVFRMGSGCTVEGVLVEDFEIDDLDDPNEGFAFSFRPDAVIFRTPYIAKIAVRNTPTWLKYGIAPPLDRDNKNPLVGVGGGVCIADASVCSPFSIYPNIMTWGATPIVNNGIAYCAKNGGLVNAVNAISLWAHKHFYAKDGGQVILSGCTCQFGDYSLVSEGYRYVINPYEAEEIDDTVALEIIPNITSIFTESAVNTIIDTMWSDLVSGGLVTGWTPEQEAKTRRDAAILIQCISWVLQSAKEKPMIDFARGLFDKNGNPYFLGDGFDYLNAFLASYDSIETSINALVPSNAQSIVTVLISALKSTLNNYSNRKQIERSLVTAISHTWSVVMAGVALAKVPPGRNVTTIEESIIEKDNGKVYASGQDDEGSAIFVGGLKIDADTGELNGPPFDTAVNRIATRTAIARSF